ncbi:MAG: DUF11 domain-containing protein, partial [Chloroflexota bacterium]|nr:DUF11 domain-containing protein [Chloroflexota bacterium]
MKTRNYTVLDNPGIHYGRFVGSLLIALSLGKHFLSALIGWLLRITSIVFTTKSARRRVSIFFSSLIVASMLLEPFSYSAGSASAAAPGATDSLGHVAPSANSTVPPLPRLPEAPVTMIPLGDAHLPFLAIDLDVSPKYVTQGDIFTATVTLRNEARDPADNVVLTLSQPAGIERIERPQKGTQASAPTSNQGGWTWQLSRLNPNSNTTVTAVMRLTRPQPGDAVVLEATASADRLSAPAVRMGGALVIQKGAGPSTARYNPSSPASLRSADGRVEVRVPGNAFKQSLILEHEWQIDNGQRGPVRQAGRKQIFPAFELNAKDAQGNNIHKFSAPLTISLSYTPQQLQAVGILEEDLTVFWFDESAPQGGRWTRIPSSVDSSRHTVTASVNHFSLFALSDDSSPSTAFIPSLQGWQVGLYSGDVTYQYDIEVPTGPAGVKPSLGLSYNSTATDTRIDTRWRPQSQSSWVGKGWSLDTGYVALNRLSGDPEAGRYYSLVFDGKSYDLVRGAPRVQNPNLAKPNEWEWHPTDESFIRARAETTGTLTTRGSGDSTAQRYLWKVWNPDGTLFVFEEDAWQGFSSCGVPDESFIEAYKWHLTLVEDTHGNQIEYKYARNTPEEYRSCGQSGLRLYPDFEVVPSEILWGKNKNVALTDANHKHRFRVVFGSSSRGTVDDEWDHAENQIGPAPHQTLRLDTITVQSKPSTTEDTWERVRQYNLAYETNTSSMLLSDSTTRDANGVLQGDPTLTKLTLKSIQRLDKNANSPLPPTPMPAVTFGYMTGTNAGNGTYVAGAWNRLTTVDNGQGGKITFTYENIGTDLANPNSPDYAPLAAPKFAHNRRVKTKVVEDGRGNSYTWSYDYRYPAYNSLGTSDQWGTEVGPNVKPNSASVY